MGKVLLFQAIPPASAMEVVEGVDQPSVLTPEVLVFFVTICFLAIFGSKR